LQGEGGALTSGSLPVAQAISPELTEEDSKSVEERAQAQLAAYTEQMDKQYGQELDQMRALLTKVRPCLTLLWHVYDTEA
jgi:hypothetical protein